MQSKRIFDTSSSDDDDGLLAELLESPPPVSTGRGRPQEAAAGIASPKPLASASARTAHARRKGKEDGRSQTRTNTFDSRRDGELGF